MSARRVRWLFAAAAAGVLLVCGVGWASDADASPAGASCQTVPWGFLASQRRTLCDGPVRADGSWERLRVVWSPARQIPLTCAGVYVVSCSGGYFVGESVVSREVYPVTPGTVLADEPQHLVGAA